MNKGLIYLLLLSISFLACENKTTTKESIERIKKDSVIIINNKLIDSSEKKQIDSFVLIYNSLPKKRLYNSSFMQGKMSFKNGKYILYYKGLAESGSPDSIQEGYYNKKDNSMSIGLGDNYLEFSFFKDSVSKDVFSVIKASTINQHYMEDSQLLIYRTDSSNNSKEITDLTIDRKKILLNYTALFKPNYQLGDLFRIQYNHIDKIISLHINQGKRKWDCDENKFLICKISTTQLEDSLKLVWNSDSARFIIKHPRK